MKDKVERSAFPKCGDYLSVVKFICETPPSQHDRVYVGPVLGKPGLYNFALFPMPVVSSNEQKELLRTAEAVAKLSGNGVTDSAHRS